jgi:alpha-tubulin suppressor-like RCC1 family protein
VNPNGLEADSPTPVKIPGVHDAKQIALSYETGFALLEDGSVMAWGDNSSGMLGPMANPPYFAPMVVPSLHGVRAISASYQSFCALLDDGAVWCSGSNDRGQLGQGTTDAVDGDKPITTPVQVPGLTAQSIAVGSLGSCARRTGTPGDIVCFGQFAYGSMGTGAAGQGEAASPGSAVVLPK